MDQDKLEEIFDEVVSQLIENIRNRNLEEKDARAIVNGIERVASNGSLLTLWDLDENYKDTNWYAEEKKFIFDYEVNVSDEDEDEFE